MARFWCYLAVCLLAGGVPLWTASRPATAIPAQRDFPGWPRQWEGRELRQLPLSAREERFLDNFPGRVGRFTDGSREIIIRWVAAPTRQLHPAADCFAALGYELQPLALRVDEQGQLWGALSVVRQGERLNIYELITDSDQRNWPDVSAWYWAAFAGQSAGPWWTYTIAERAP